MPQEKKRPKALLLLSASYLRREIQFSTVFPQIEKEGCERIWVPAYDFSLHDGYFAELKLFPKALQKELKDELLHVLLPKHAILVIVGNEETDKAALGFKVED